MNVTGGGGIRILETPKLGIAKNRLGGIDLIRYEGFKGDINLTFHQVIFDIMSFCNEEGHA